jgi:menaquinone-9 beta-reductase
MNFSSAPSVLVAGAGPAGIAASLILSKNKIHHIIADKALFPRDKICGDALSGKVVDALNTIDGKITERILPHSDFVGSYGVSFFAPNGKRLDVPFSLMPEKLKHPPGFLSKRIDFDHFLFQELSSEFATVLQQTEITEAVNTTEGIKVVWKKDGRPESRLFKLVIGAEGDRSVIRRSLTNYKKEKDHYCAGVRAYYSNVKETHTEHFIELHFLKDILPGYLWIFPMSGGICNVGIGMLSSVVSKKRINLKTLLKDLLANHPSFKKRFANALQDGEIHGWGLPLGSKKYPLSGDNFLLTGDAASLIDPFTGEGIGNAMLSGITAAEFATKAIRTDAYDAASLRAYDRSIYSRLGSELQLSHTMQRLSSFPFLFNFVVNKSLKSKTLKETIICMFEDVDLRSRLSSPSFYLKLLMNR